MTARAVIGLSWTLIAGLVGGWLMLSPWAMGQRTSGGWSRLVRTEFFGGAGLVALSLICLLVVAAQVLEAVGGRSRRVVATRAPGAESPELERTLVAVAQALTADLTSRAPATDGEPGPQPADRADRAPQPADSRSYDGRRDER